MNDLTVILPDYPSTPVISSERVLCQRRTRITRASVLSQ